MANGTLIRSYGDENGACIIFFPGQRGGVKYYERTLFNRFQSVGFQVFSLSYPGQEGAIARVDSVERFIVEIKEEVERISLDCLPSKTIVYGRSLGATLAAYSANTPYIVGVILEGASISLDKAIYHYLYKRWYLKPLNLLPIHALLRENYPLLDALVGLSEKPVVIYQGENDEVTPLRDISILLNHSDTVDLKVVANGKHHNTYYLALPDIIETASRMVKN
ncbi:alpha/beta hydrolase [Colwellia asteriadis]